MPFIPSLAAALFLVARLPAAPILGSDLFPGPGSTAYTIRFADWRRKPYRPGIRDCPHFGSRPGIPASTRVSYSFIGNLGSQDIRTIEYVSGYGLIGADGHRIYTIDQTTGAAALLFVLAIVLPPAGGISPITGLAYDPDTGRLVGSSRNTMGPGGPGLPRLYDINLSSGLAGWLNATPPDFSGIATVTPSPEPGAAPLVIAGLLALWARLRIPHARFSPVRFRAASNVPTGSPD